VGVGDRYSQWIAGLSLLKTNEARLHDGQEPATNWEQGAVGARKKAEKEKTWAAGEMTA